MEKRAKLCGKLSMRSFVMDRRTRLRNESGSGYQIVLREFWKYSVGKVFLEEDWSKAGLQEYTGSSFHLLWYINYRREGGTIDDIREKYFTNINQVESNSYNFIIRTFEEKMRRIKTNLYLWFNLVATPLQNSRKRDGADGNSIIHRYWYRYLLVHKGVTRFLRSPLAPSSSLFLATQTFSIRQKSNAFSPGRRTERESAMESRSNDLINVPDCPMKFSTIPLLLLFLLFLLEKYFEESPSFLPSFEINLEEEE